MGLPFPELDWGEVHLESVWLEALPYPDLRVPVVLRDPIYRHWVLEVFLYRHLSKKRRRKAARLLEAGRADPETGMFPPQQRPLMNPTWSPGGPHPGTAYHAGGSGPHDALPYILAMARRHEEQEFQRGGTRMTELLEDIQPFPRQATTHALGECRKAANNRAADELDALIMASLGRPNALQVGPTTSGSPPPLHEKSPV